MSNRNVQNLLKHMVDRKNPYGQPRRGHFMSDFFLEIKKERFTPHTIGTVSPPELIQNFSANYFAGKVNDSDEYLKTYAAKPRGWNGPWPPDSCHLQALWDNGQDNRGLFILNDLVSFGTVSYRVETFEITDRSTGKLLFELDPDYEPKSLPENYFLIFLKSVNSATPYQEIAFNIVLVNN